VTSPTVEHDGAAVNPNGDDLELIDEGSPGEDTARRWPERGTLLALGFTLLVLGVLHVSLADSLRSPIIHADEAGYLGQARYIVDGYGRVNAGYYAGYSLLLAPAAMIAEAPVRFFRLVVVTNFGLALITAALAFALVRVLFPKSPRWVAVTTVIVSALYPLTFAFTGIAMSENGLVFATSAAALAVAQAARSRNMWWWGVAGLIASYSYWVSPRGILVAAAFGAALGLEKFRTRLPWRVAFAGLAGVGFGVVTGHVFNKIVKGSDYIAGVSGRKAGPFDIVFGFDGYPDWLAGIGARVAYLGAASAGMFLVGAIAAAIWSFVKESDPLSSARRATGLFALLMFGFTLVGDAASQSQKDVLRRLDFLYYGRYTEGVAMPLMVLGIAWLLTTRSRKQLLAVAVAVPSLIFAGLAAAYFLEPKRPAEITANLVNLLSVLPLRYWFGSETVADALVMGMVVAFVVLLLRVAHQVVGAAALLIVFAAGGLVTHDHFVENGAASRSDQRAIVDLIERLEANGVPTDCIAQTDPNQESYWHIYNYRAFLPHSKITQKDKDQCGPLVLSGKMDNQYAQAGAWFAGAENHVPVGLWVDQTKLDPAVAARIRDNGMIYPNPVCELQAPATYVAPLTADITDVSDDGMTLKIDAFHEGNGAPWLGSNTVITGGCGRVAAMVELQDEDGTVLYSHRGTIPRTTLPGEHARFTTKVQAPPEVNMDEVELVRVALVEDGVTWFNERGGATDVVFVRGTDF
jgi:hypothetical protein